MAFVQVRSSGHADALARLQALGEGNQTLAEGVSELRQVIDMLKDLDVPESDTPSTSRSPAAWTTTPVPSTRPRSTTTRRSARSAPAAATTTSPATTASRSSPGVGISIGATRLFYQLREAGILKLAESSVQVLVGLMEDARLGEALQIGSELRAAGLNTEVQLEAKKLAKQFQYADRAGIRFVVLVGEDEAARGAATLKDLRSQEQFEEPRAKLAHAIKAKLESHA
jgi:histidyl-tRNA synthetase